MSTTVTVTPPQALVCMEIQMRWLAILPCCEKAGVIWGRSVNGTEWAECMGCGAEYAGYMAGENEQRKLYRKIEKRKAHNAATAA
jgi:hypothetical protein